MVERLKTISRDRLEQIVHSLSVFADDAIDFDDRHMSGLFPLMEEIGMWSKDDEGNYED